MEFWNRPPYAMSSIEKVLYLIEKQESFLLLEESRSTATLEILLEYVFFDLKDGKVILEQKG